MSLEVRCSVIPAAGKGTRMYPLTKSVPKELFPLVDRPVIMTVIDEALQCGIEQFHVVTSPRKATLGDFFTDTGDESDSQDLPLPQVDLVMQEQAKGLGHAVLQARDSVGEQPFVVQLPDDLYHPEDPLLQTMLDVHAITGGCVVALMKVSVAEAKLYSSARVESVDLGAAAAGHEVFKLADIIEKPDADQVRSPYALMGRYVLSPRIFEILERTAPGRNNEIQLTDALATFAEIPAHEGGGVWGVVSQGRHFDTGNLTGYLQAQMELSLENPDFGDELRKFMRGLVGTDESTVVQTPPGNVANPGRKAGAD